MFARHIARSILALATTSTAIVALTIPIAVRAADDAQHHEHKGKSPTSMAQLMKMDPEECMKMMDKEHKGHVTRKEFMKFQEELWQRMDKNKDGRVDRVEFTDAG